MNPSRGAFETLLGVLYDCAEGNVNPSRGAFETLLEVLYELC